MSSHGRSKEGRHLNSKRKDSCPGSGACKNKKQQASAEDQSNPFYDTRAKHARIAQRNSQTHQCRPCMITIYRRRAGYFVDPRRKRERAFCPLSFGFVFSYHITYRNRCTITSFSLNGREIQSKHGPQQKIHFTTSTPGIIFLFKCLHLHRMHTSDSN